MKLQTEKRDIAGQGQKKAAVQLTQRLDGVCGDGVCGAGVCGSGV
jgi:hypothetical protein